MLAKFKIFAFLSLFLAPVFIYGATLQYDQLTATYACACEQCDCSNCDCNNCSCDRC